MKELADTQMMSNARNAALSTCLKAIYITAMEANTLSDDGLILAENLVDNYIAEKGGAEKIFNEVGNSTYLLSKLVKIVEDSAKEETEEIKKIDVDSLGEDEEEVDVKEEEDTSDDGLDDASGKDKEEDKKDIDKELDPQEEEKDEDESDSEDEEDDENEDKDDEEDEDEEDKNEHLRQAGTTDDDEESVESDDVDDKLDDSSKESDSDDNDEDVDKKLDSDEDDDNDEEDVVIDNDEDSGSKDASVNDTDEKGNSSSKIYDELENEEDVQKAVELIKTRVADAEEAFIKRNSEDKEKMDDLLNKISDNVKTVEKIADNDSTKSKIAKENVQMAHREISKLHDKPQSIFEAMIRNLSSSVIKDNESKEKFINENGSLDMSSIIETAKVMYGFLETLNTLQLEKVDGEYIKNALSQI